VGGIILIMGIRFKVIKGAGHGKRFEKNMQKYLHICTKRITFAADLA
jgi:hypothetical protein